jgi:capsular polysaccharide biosynthesis protein
MRDGFDALEFAGYMHARWRRILVCCAAALLLSGVGSLLLPKQYTATASLLIQPPAGLDPRGATAVSPVYLESLKTFEHLASSDSLFLQALDQLHIREKYSGRSIESLKRSVLEISKPVSTRIIQIHATLRDAKEAQGLARYIAEQTVALSRSLDDQSAAATIKETQLTFDRAEIRFRNAQKAQGEFAAGQTDDVLSAELDSAGELKYQVDRDLGKARAELADYSSQEASGAADTTGGNASGWNAHQVASARARVADLEAQDRRLEQTIGTKGRLLDRLKQRHESLDAELKSALTDFEASRTKLGDLKASAAFRGERLEVMDPGIVPERPSSPNVLLNMLVALVLSVTASVAWLAIRFGYERMAGARSARAYSLR